MKKYDSENETYWEVNFFDMKNEQLIDLYLNTDKEEDIETLKEKAINKGYDTMEIVKVVKETTRYHI